MFPDASAIIFIVSSAYVGFTILLNKKLGSRDRIRFLQSEINSFQKEMKEAAEKNDEKRLAALSSREKQVTGHMMEMMWLPWKSLVFILPVFFLLIGTNGFLGINFHGVIPTAFPVFSIVLPFNLHISSLFPAGLFSFSPGALASSAPYGSRGFFIVCAIFAGIVLESVVSRFEKQGAKSGTAAENKPN